MDGNDKSNSSSKQWDGGSEAEMRVSSGPSVRIGTRSPMMRTLAGICKPCSGLVPGLLGEVAEWNSIAATKEHSASAGSRGSW